MPLLPVLPRRDGEPEVRTALRSGDISACDLDRQLAVAASLERIMNLERRLF